MSKGFTVEPQNTIHDFFFPGFSGLVANPFASADAEDTGTSAPSLAAGGGGRSGRGTSGRRQGTVGNRPKNTKVSHKVVKF